MNTDERGCLIPEAQRRGEGIQRLVQRLREILLAISAQERVRAAKVVVCDIDEANVI